MTPGTAHERLARNALTTGEAGSAGGQTLIAALLPVLLAPHAPSTFWIGAVIATEGFFALTLPYLSGAVSDAMPRRFARFFGRRGAMLALAMPFMALSLLVIPFRNSFWALAGVAVIYFAALHAFSTPLRAMLIDATPVEDWGKIQGVMGATHLAGVTFGLVAGGLLFSIYEPLPFIVGAGLLVMTTAVTLRAARVMRLGQGGEVNRDAGSGERPARGEWHFAKEIEFWKDLIRNGDSRWFLAANVLWNAGTEGIRPYLFLFATVVLRIAVRTASLAMLAFLGAAAVGSIIVGRIGDRFGRSRVLLAGALITGVAMLPGFFVRDLFWLIVLLVPAGLGAAALVSLPYPVFATIAGESDIGRSTGAFYMSVGLARMTAPLAVGATIDLAATWMPDQEGYPAMWPAAGAMTLMGAATLYLAMRREDWQR